MRGRLIPSPPTPGICHDHVVLSDDSVLRRVDDRRCGRGRGTRRERCHDRRRAAGHRRQTPARRPQRRLLRRRGDRPEGGTPRLRLRRRQGSCAAHRREYRVRDRIGQQADDGGAAGRPDPRRQGLAGRSAVGLSAQGQRGADVRGQAHPAAAHRHPYLGAAGDSRRHRLRPAESVFQAGRGRAAEGAVDHVAGAGAGREVRILQFCGDAAVVRGGAPRRQRFRNAARYPRVRAAGHGQQLHQPQTRRGESGRRPYAGHQGHAGLDLPDRFRRRRRRAFDARRHGALRAGPVRRRSGAARRRLPPHPCAGRQRRESADRDALDAGAAQRPHVPRARRRHRRVLVVRRVRSADEIRRCDFVGYRIARARRPRQSWPASARLEGAAGQARHRRIGGQTGAAIVGG